MKNILKRGEKASNASASLAETPEYTSAHYAKAGDVFNLTRAEQSGNDYNYTGDGVEWNYRNLTGVSQRQISFISAVPSNKNEKQINPAPIPQVEYLQVLSNDYIALGASVLITNISDYFFKTSSMLNKTGVSSSVDRDLSDGTTPAPEQKIFPQPMTKYYFPLTPGSTLNLEGIKFNFSTENMTDPDLSGLPEKIQQLIEKLQSNVDYISLTVIISRKIAVDGFGTLSTPYISDKTETLRVVTESTEVSDGFIYTTDGEQIPVSLTVTTREIAWFHPEFKYQLLTVNQVKNGENWVTLKEEYYDNVQAFPAAASFVYFPARPAVNDYVQMQNLSTNGKTFHWEFTDETGTVIHESDLISTGYTFENAGTYSIKLTASNETSTDEISHQIRVHEKNSQSRMKHKSGLDAVSLFPESSRNYIFLNHLPEGTSLSVIDSKGKIVLAQHANRLLDVISLKAGNYLLALTHNNETRKISFVKK